MAHSDFTPSEFASLKRHPLGPGRAVQEENIIRPRGKTLDLRGLLIEHNDTVDLIPIHTNNMRASGLLHGGMAIVDRTAKPRIGDLVAVRFNGVVIMRRLQKREGKHCLVSDDPREEVLFVEGAEIERLGNVIWSLFKP